MTNTMIETMLNNYLNALALNTEIETVTDVLTLVENPFLERKGIDIPSLLFHRFYKNTDIPTALPIFAFLALMSAYCVKSKATYNMPRAGLKAYELDTWVMALAPSGSSKTLAMTQIMSLIPTEFETGEPVLSPNFDRPNGPAAMVQQLAKLPSGRGFWFQDEASQFFEVMEQLGSPMAECKEFILKMKDHAEITRVTKDEIIKTEPIVMTQFFINTGLAMAKSVSDRSLYDGTLRRYQFAYADNDDRKFTDFAYYELNRVSDTILQDEFEAVFTQKIDDNVYTFDSECEAMYSKMFKVFWEKQYIKFMVGHENTYRTTMMESFKYAIFHHIFHKKDGLIISAESMQYALKVVMYLLNSLQTFVKMRLDNRVTKRDVKTRNVLSCNLKSFILAHENEPGFGFRVVSRKFGKTKDEIISMLVAIKSADKKFKTKLFEVEKKKKPKKLTA